MCTFICVKYKHIYMHVYRCLCVYVCIRVRVYADMRVCVHLYCCSAHCTGRFMCDKDDQSSMSFCVAGAVVSEVGVSLFVAGAAVREHLGDNRSA